MNGAQQLFVDSLEVRFLDIRRFDLDYTWRIMRKRLSHSVLWLLLEGKISVELDHHVYKAGEGDVLLLPDQAVLSSSAISSSLRLISINFDAKIPLCSNNNWTQILQLPVRTENVAPEVGRIADEMLEAKANPSLGNNLLLQAGLLRIVAALLRELGSVGEVSAAPGFDQRILTIIAYLAGHPGWLPEVKQMAELVQMSVSHFRHLFQKHTGQSPMHFVHAFKIEAACKLLAFDHQRVSQIAYDLGFKDPNYFSRLFRSKTGLSPQDYRKRHRLLEMQPPSVQMKKIINRPIV